MCDHHVAVSVCVDTGLLATSMCPNRVPQAKVTLPAMQQGVAEAVTLDTAYGIGSNLPSATCTLHTGGVYVPSEYELGGNPGAAPDPNAVDPNAGDPNAVDPNAVDPNAVPDPNAGVDPNTGVDPNAGVPPTGVEGIPGAGGE